MTKASFGAATFWLFMVISVGLILHAVFSDVGVMQAGAELFIGVLIIIILHIAVYTLESISFVYGKLGLSFRKD